MTARRTTYTIVDTLRDQDVDRHAQTAHAATKPACFDGQQIDSDSRLMEAHYRLRYQVYCVERGFLDSNNYPDRREQDEFDRFAVHVGVVDRDDTLIACARLVRVNMAGLPLFRHCQVFPHETELYHEGNRVAELGRLCISRSLRRRRDGSDAIAVSLYRAVYQASKRNGFTHWLVATEPSLQRLLNNFGVPFRAIGPTTDYFGAVTPYVVDLRVFDAVIASGSRPLLRTFPEGLEPELSPMLCAQAG